MFLGNFSRKVLVRRATLRCEAAIGATLRCEAAIGATVRCEAATGATLRCEAAKGATVRFASSALLVPGRAARQRFAVFSPQLDFDWIQEKREIVSKICEVKGIHLCIDKSIKSWERYKELKSKEKSIALMVTGLDNEISSFKGDKSRQSEKLQVIEKRKTVKSDLNKLREVIWDLEETDILSLLNFPNFSDFTPLADEVIFTFGKPKTFDFTPKSHIALGEDLNLVEFSRNSHTSFYLCGKLALLELKIAQYFKHKLLSHGFEMMSNPDFTKSVIAEGCGRTIEDPDGCFSLKPAQDFGDLTSLNAMHLVGGASLEPFAAFWCRQILNNPRILPVNAFCVGRQYQPRREANAQGLFNTAQSAALEMFSVSGCEEEMMEQLGKLRAAADEMYQVLGHFRVVDVGVVGLSRCDQGAASYQVRSGVTGEWVEVGRVRKQGNYFSRRIIMKQKVEDGVADMWTLGGTAVNVTKLIGILLEMHQDQSGQVDCDKLCQLFAC